MSSVDLSTEEWQTLINILATANGPGISWTVTNPLLAKISEQVRRQSLAGNSKEMPAAEGQVESRSH